jgi:SPP1 family holin
VDNKQPETQVVVVPAEAPKVNVNLVVRTIIYLFAIVNAAAAYFGFDFNIEVSGDFIYEGVSLVFGVGAFISAYWKNNDITKGARIKAKAAEQIATKKEN